MKTKILPVLLLLAASTPSFAVTISQWTFESPKTPPDVTDSTTQTGVLPNSGSGTASGVHASAATDWSTPVGNGSAESWSANNWAVGDYFQFQLSIAGFQGITVSWDQMRSSTGPATFDFAYSVNGTTFINGLNDYAVSATSWSSPSVDLSAAPLLVGASTVYFRLTADSAAGGTAGTGRIDNFTVSGTPVQSVPESLPRGVEVVAFLALLMGGWLVWTPRVNPAMMPLRRSKKRLSR